MKNNTILLSSNPKGVFLEGFVSGTPLPGTWMQIQANVAPVGGRHTWVFYQPTNDGDPRLVAIALEDADQGKTTSDAYVSGSRIFLYCPLPGEEMNVLTRGEPGTGSANAFFIGTRLMGGHTDGKFIVQNSSSGNAAFLCLEHIDQVPDVDTLVWAQRA